MKHNRIAMIAFILIQLFAGASQLKAQFRIVDEQDGKPVSGAKVEFKIYNYAEFYTAVTKQTDAQGRTSLSAGMGDLLIWASKDGNYGYSKASFGKDNPVTITLNHNMLSDKSKASFEEHRSSCRKRQDSLCKR